MKFRLVLLIIAGLAVSSTQVKAQYEEPSRVKVLPTIEPGIIKLLYALETSEPIQVRFFNASGQVGQDVIKGSYPKGVTKRYDIRKISTKDLRMEVSTAKMTVMYRLSPSKNKYSFTPQLEKTTYNHGLVASNNQ